MHGQIGRLSSRQIPETTFCEEMTKSEQSRPSRFIVCSEFRLIFSVFFSFIFLYFFMKFQGNPLKKSIFLHFFAFFKRIQVQEFKIIKSHIPMLFTLLETCGVTVDALNFLILKIVYSCWKLVFFQKKN